MIDLEQKVETTWCPSNKDYLIKRGYIFTKYKDKIVIKAKDLMPRSEKYVNVVCDYCLNTVSTKFCNYMMSTKDGVEKYSCKKCKGIKAHEKNYDKNIYYQRYIQACEKKGFLPLTSFDDFQGTSSNVLINCPKHGKQNERYYYVVNGIGCDECSKEIHPVWNKYSQQQVKEIIEAGTNNIWLNPGDYLDVFSKNIEIQCGRCGKPYITSIQIYQGGYKMCQQCSREIVSDMQRLSQDEVIRRITETEENQLLNPQDYISNNTMNLQISCKCGEIFITSLNNYKKGKTKCDKCSNSKSSGEQLIENILREFDIYFIPEHSFHDCRDKNALPFDFYLPDYNCCIEFDGQGHYEPIFGEESYLTTIKHDKIKNNYCEINNIKIVRIPFWEANNASKIISNALRLKKYPIVINYNKNPYE